MDFVQDLSNLDYQRVFIVGNILGDYNKLVNLMYQQRFCHKDILITTGDFVDIDEAFNPANERQLETIIFLKNVTASFSVKGKNEFDFLRKLEDKGHPGWLSNHPKAEQILNFIEELPLIIKVSDYIYIVNAGVQPHLSIEEQDPEVFYSIGDYDKDSRFYQFDNPGGDSWYNFDILSNDEQIKLCFCKGNPKDMNVPAGHYLGRNPQEPLKALVFRKGQEDAPVLIES